MPVLVASLTFAACGGGSSSPDDSSGGAESLSPSRVQAEVTISGRVTFDFVPSVPGRDQGLAYADTEPRPARAVTVEARADGEAVATTRTDPAGEYALELPANRTVSLRVRAEMIRDGSPAWDVRVVDNTDADALYVLEGAPFDTGDADSTRDLHAPSGWTGASYGGERSAAPFAILDTIYDAMQLVLDAEAGLAFPPLVVHWSPENRPTRGDFERGEIGSSLYSSGSGMYVLGAENSDTDEYDRHVIAHEWGHYFENEFSRSDSLGGPHSLGDRLDMRTAFGEGFGNAFSGMVTGSPVYRDAAGHGQSDGFGFDMEGRAELFPGDNPAPGWFSEQSVHEMLWDIYDDARDGDGLALGFEPIYSVFRGPQASTPALTSVFSFFAALKDARPADAAALDALTSANAIEPVQNAYGEGEDNDAGTSNGNILPVYRDDLVVGGGAVSDVCSTNEFESDASGAQNKLGSRRFLRFSVARARPHTITVTTTLQPADADYADPDFVVHRGGILQRSANDPSEYSDVCKDPASAPETCIEQWHGVLEAGEYVLEVYEWTNTNRSEDEEPIGRTCFDVEISAGS